MRCVTPFAGRVLAIEWLGIARRNTKRFETSEQRLNVVRVIVMKNGLDSQSVWHHQVVFAVVNEDAFLGAHARATQCVQEDLRTLLVGSNFG